MKEFAKRSLLKELPLGRAIQGAEKVKPIDGAKEVKSIEGNFRVKSIETTDVENCIEGIYAGKSVE